MSEIQDGASQYAHLPDELLAKMLDAVPVTVDKMNAMFDVQGQPIDEGVASLRAKGMIRTLGAGDVSNSLVAVDGSNIVDRMTGTDILLSVAVGVEGLSQDDTVAWGSDKSQYDQWQTVLPHGDANARLSQGIMFLMELSVLARSGHEIRIMDGNHFTAILKINSMLSAKEDNAGADYADALRDFLKQHYDKVIPDIPSIISAALGNENILAMVKYSSSRDVISAYLDPKTIHIDDKTLFTLGLRGGEYLAPLSVGQSADERKSIWDELHIWCNLDIPERDQLNEALEKAIAPIKTRTSSADGGTHKQSDLFYTYFKPFEGGPAYRLEIKRGVAEDQARLERCLRSIKAQIVFPEIREPYPQFLADLMAKSVSGGLRSIKEAIRLSQDIKLDDDRINLLFDYRT